MKKDNLPKGINIKVVDVDVYERKRWGKYSAVTHAFFSLQPGKTLEVGPFKLFAEANAVRNGTGGSIRRFAKEQKCTVFTVIEKTETGNFYVYIQKRITEKNKKED